MNALRLLLLSLLLILPAPLALADGPVLVELFASKNCRNCPKAHETLKAVSASDKDMLVLTWSVSYWDYLGGRDKMAIPESEDRQRHYAEYSSQRGPYTPQTVYDGAIQCPGNKPKQVAASLEKARALAETKVRLVKNTRGIELTGTASGLTDIWLVHYLEGRANQTKMLNPVTKVENLGPWLGGRTQLPAPACPSGCAMIVQEAAFGRVLASLDLTP